MVYKYNTFGTCAQKIEIEIDENEIIRNVEFSGAATVILKELQSLLRVRKLMMLSPDLKESNADSNQPPVRISLHQH